jgi:hypothetical protein
MRREASAPAPAPRNAFPKLIGWQGLTVRVPESWDLTGFSGDDASGYVRIDDGEQEQAVEIKWATEPKRAKTAPDVTVRRESYFRALRTTAKKKRLALTTKDTDAPKGAARPERTATGFTWVGDRKGVGAVWYCATCRRVVIAQVLGDPSGKGGLGSAAEKILGSLECHSADPDWRTWALYDLETRVPADYKLVGQQLMNVYLRLSFAKGTARLSVEQWAVANVARRDSYLDVWLGSNSKGEMASARYGADEAEGGMHGHPAVALNGGLAFGMPMVDAVKDAGRQFKLPATRFTGVAWQCDTANKIFLVESLRPAREPDVTREVAERTVCHGGTT